MKILHACVFVYIIVVFNFGSVTHDIQSILTQKNTLVKTGSNVEYTELMRVDSHAILVSRCT